MDLYLLPWDSVDIVCELSDFDLQIRELMKFRETLRQPFCGSSVLAVVSRQVRLVTRRN